MKSLFSIRCEAQFQESKIKSEEKGDFGATWPYAKLALYETRLIITIPKKGEFPLNYKNIEYIDWQKEVGIQIHHVDKNLKPVILLRGIGMGKKLFKKIYDAIKKNNINIRIETERLW